MLIQLTIAVLAAAAAANSMPHLPAINPFTPNGQIVGGEDVTIEEVPHQVSLQVNGFGFCGGTIVAKQWILTAAHCMSYPADWIAVKAGSAKMSGSQGSTHKVATIIKHEKYSTNPRGIPLNDVALMKLAKPLQLDATRQPAKLFELNEEALPGIAATITGWGAKKEGGSVAEVLQKAKVPVVSKEVCSDAYAQFGGVPAGQICAAYPKGGTDACQGDSGGPMTIGGRLAGIVSWGNGCARPGYPGVYTEVASYRDWIDANMAK